MSKRLAGPLVLALSLSSALAGGGHPTTAPWQGTAQPVNPPTRCVSMLPAPTRDAQGGYHYGPVYAAKPLQIASCWKGTLKGKPFTLTGYGSAEADTAVALQYDGKTTPLALGTNGSPTVIAFSDTVICFVPNPAKGILVAVDAIRARTLSDELLANRVCQPERFWNDTGRLMVGGLKANYLIGYGVIRTY